MLPLLCQAGSYPGTSPEVYAILVSPKSVTTGSMFHVMITSEIPVAGGELGADGPSGNLAPLKACMGGGPPFWFTATFNADQAGEYYVRLKKDETILAFKSFRVAVQKQSRMPSRFVWNAICIRPGSKGSSYMQKREPHGVLCTKSCMIPEKTSSTTIWDQERMIIEVKTLLL